MGVDLVVLDADIAGCVITFLKRGKLNLNQTAILGLSYQSASAVVPVLNEQGAAYFWRLERLAELIKAVALGAEAEHKRLNLSDSRRTRIKATQSPHITAHQFLPRG